MFVDEKTRRNRDMTPANEATRRQVVFKGIFPEAAACKDDDYDDSESVNVGGTIFEF